MVYFLSFCILIAIGYLIIGAMLSRRSDGYILIRPGLSDVLLRVGLPLLYLFLIGNFHYIDVYHQYFFESNGLIYISYNIGKALYCFFLIWILFYLGKTITRLFITQTCFVLSEPLVGFITCFWVGAAVLNSSFFILGYFNLYYKSVALLITLVLLIFSGRSFVDFLNTISAALGQKNLTGNPLEKIITALLLGLLAGTSIIIIVGQGLFPLAEHDYNTHYFPYLMQVIENHGIWPNDLWYHYWYSKAQGLTFLSMLLIDPLAGQLVNFSFFIMTALTLYALLRHVSVQSYLPLAGVIMFQVAFLEQPPWGKFIKNHILTMSFMAGSFWMLYLLPEKSKQYGTSWFGLTIIVIGGQIVFAPTSYPITFCFCIGYSVLLLMLREQKAASRVLITAFCGLSILIGMLLLNQLTIGMAESTPFRIWWPFADQSRMSKWFSPYLWLALSEGSAPDLGGIVLPKSAVLFHYPHWQNLLRLKASWFLLPDWRVIPGLIVINIAIYLKWDFPKRPSCGPLLRLFLMAVGLLAAAALVSLFTSQQTSVSRYYIFAVFYVVLAATLLWQLPELLFPASILRCVLCGLAALILSSWAVGRTLEAVIMTEKRNFVSTRPDVVKNFVIGKIPLAKAFDEWGALWKPAVDIRRITGLGTRVRAFHITRYCMAPDAYLESEISFGLKGEWHNILFGPADFAAKLLKQQKLDYFLIDTDHRFFDLLAYSDLFCSKNIARFFCVAWRDANTYLLTWRTGDKCFSAVTDEFLERFGEQCRASENHINMSALYNRMKLYYDRHAGQKYPIAADPSLPPIKGWQ